MKPSEDDLQHAALLLMERGGSAVVNPPNELAWIRRTALNVMKQRFRHELMQGSAIAQFYGYAPDEYEVRLEVYRKENRENMRRKYVPQARRTKMPTNLPVQEKYNNRYKTDEERQAARRESWRRSSVRKYARKKERDRILASTGVRGI